jgi:hypothetical protein
VGLNNKAGRHFLLDALSMQVESSMVAATVGCLTDHIRTYADGADGAWFCTQYWFIMIMHNIIRRPKKPIHKRRNNATMS